MPLLFLDTETTGLEPERHEVWEIAWAYEDGPVHSAFVRHVGLTADPEALRLNGYHERYSEAELVSADHERGVYTSWDGYTLVGANPAFDASFLRARWGKVPWRYRLLDVEAYAMPHLGYDVPQGLAKIAEALGVEAPDHTAAADVHVLRECWRKLRVAYGH